MARSRRAAAALLLLAGCAAPAAHWRDDLPAALTSARAERRDVVVFFARPGVDASDRTVAGLTDAEVGAALAGGGYVAVLVDAAAQERLFERWLGGREGFGVSVLDQEGRVYASRPGPLDPDELAALLRLAASRRAALAAARSAAAVAGAGPGEQHTLGCLLLSLGAREACEGPLIDAAMGGVTDARHRLARLYATGGNLGKARAWLEAAPRTPSAQVTEGIVLFFERQYERAAAVLEPALRTGRLGDERQLAMLYLGRAWHEVGHDDRARPLLESLSAEGTGSVAEAGARRVLRRLSGGDGS